MKPGRGSRRFRCKVVIKWGSRDSDIAPAHTSRVQVWMQKDGRRRCKYMSGDPEDCKAQLVTEKSSLKAGR